MKRILSTQLSDYAGSEVVLKGWVHSVRHLGQVSFIILRDRSGLCQVVVEGDQLPQVASIMPGSVVEASGRVVAQPDGGHELHAGHVALISEVTEPLPIEIGKDFKRDEMHLATVLDHRSISLRAPKERAIFSLQAKIMQVSRQILDDRDFTEMRTPKLLAESTEGGAEVFTLDYFGQTATLAQSAQFYKQIMTAVFERVYEFGATYRAEPSVTTRHVTEFTTLDVELAFVDYAELKQFVYELVTSIIRRLEVSARGELHIWGYQSAAVGEAPLEMTIEQIHQLYSDVDGHESTVGEDDLRPAEERWICQYARTHHDTELVFVVGWPESSAKFYHKQTENGTETERFDVLFRGVEIITGSMREHRYDVLIKQMQERGIDHTAPGFAGYLEAFRAGMAPHGGIGFGIERLTYLLLGLDSVKEACLFPRDTKRLAP